jgi:hypothetical protein
MCPSRFAPVAEWAGQPEVLFVRSASGSKWNNMFNLEWHSGEALGCQTVATTITSLGCNPIAHFLGNVGPRHGYRGSDRVIW